jgi:hypothetical protein
MEERKKNILVEKARIWREANVYDWEKYDEEKKEWYLEKSCSFVARRQKCS